MHLRPISLLALFHRWLGLWVGVFLTLMLGTAALLAANNISTELHREALPGDAALSVLSPTELGEYVDAIKRRYPDTVSIRFPTADRRYFTSLYSGGSRLLGHDLSVVDDTNDGLRSVIEEVHTSLMLGKVGSTMMAWMTLASLALVIIGLALLLRYRYRIRDVLPQDTRRRSLVASHRTWGLLIAIPLIIGTISAASLVWRGQASQLLAIDRGNTQSLALAEAPERRDQAVTSLAMLWPDQRPVGVFLRKARGARSGEYVRLDFETRGAPWFEGGDSLTVLVPGGASATVSQLQDLPWNAWLLKLLRPLHDGLRLPFWYSIWLLVAMSAATWAIGAGTFSQARSLLRGRPSERTLGDVEGAV